MIRRTILYLKDIKQNKYYNILTVIENILDDMQDYNPSMSRKCFLDRGRDDAPFRTGLLIEDIDTDILPQAPMDEITIYGMPLYFLNDSFMQYPIKDKFTLEKDAEYQQVGNYLWPTQTIEKNMHRSYLRFQVNEQGIMSMTSIYCGAGNIHHNKVKVIAPDGSFAETPSSKDSYETTDMNEKIEKADYKLGEDGNVIEFLHLNKDKNIRVEYMGDRTYKTTMSPTDRLAAANVYELAQILSAMEKINKEQEEANLKIGFINKKKERKAQEEITD